MSRVSKRLVCDYDAYHQCKKHTLYICKKYLSAIRIHIHPTNALQSFIRYLTHNIKAQQTKSAHGGQLSFNCERSSFCPMARAALERLVGVISSAAAVFLLS